MVDELLQLLELHDVVESLADLSLAEPEDEAIDDHVFAPGELRVKPGADLDKHRSASLDAHLACREFEDPAGDLEERAFPEPLRPMIPRVAPRPTVKLTSRSARIYWSGAGSGRRSTDRKLLFGDGGGSPIAPGAPGPREPATPAEGLCRASGMIVKQLSSCQKNPKTEIGTAEMPV